MQLISNVGKKVERQIMKHKFGILGLVIAIVAIIIAIYQNNLRTFFNLQTSKSVERVEQTEQPKKTIGFKFKEKKFEISFGKSKEIKTDTETNKNQTFLKIVQFNLSKINLEKLAKVDF